MKKILVVLLALFVAAGVFAQEGEWSIYGDVEIGTRLNFDPDPDVDGKDDPAVVDGIAYWDWDKQHGKLGIGYSRGIANIGLTLLSEGDAVFDLAFNGDNYKGQFSFANLIAVLSGNGGGYGWWGNDTINRLWGEYKFVQGLVTVQAAVSSADTQYWVSDTTGTFKDTALARYNTGDGTVGSGLGNDGVYKSGWRSVTEPFGGGSTFTKVDHHNYLLLGADISSLSFGVMLPNLFIPLHTDPWGAGGAVDSWANYETRTDLSPELLAHALPYTVIGVKFAQSPFEFAAQFNMAHYGVYFGGQFFAGPITVGLSFMGVLDGSRDEAYDPKQIKIGGKVGYSASLFGAAISGFYSRDEVPYIPNDTYQSVIGVEPYFYYDAIPSHLRFQLDMGMYFVNEINDTADTKEKAVVWAMQPQVFWNFTGTGAATYWGFGTGVIVRYRFASADFRDKGVTTDTNNNSANFLDVAFKFSF